MGESLTQEFKAESLKLRAGSISLDMNYRFLGKEGVFTQPKVNTSHVEFYVSGDSQSIHLSMSLQKHSAVETLQYINVLILDERYISVKN